MDEKQEEFDRNLKEFYQKHLNKQIKVPQIGGKILNLYKLYQEVIKRGGGKRVTALKQ